VRKSLSIRLATYGGIALGIVLCLAYAAAPRIGGGDRSREMAAKTDINGEIKSALDQYKQDTGHYPLNLQELVQKSSGVANWHGPYFDPPKLPIDPWGNPYIYYYPGKHSPNPYDLLSTGPDGKEGTRDDIGNWMN
jgi:general secretion pathway protein G